MNQQFRRHQMRLANLDGSTPDHDAITKNFQSTPDEQNMSPILNPLDTGKLTGSQLQLWTSIKFRSFVRWHFYACELDCRPRKKLYFITGAGLPIIFCGWLAPVLLHLLYIGPIEFWNGTKSGRGFYVLLVNILVYCKVFFSAGDFILRLIFARLLNNHYCGTMWHLSESMSLARFSFFHTRVSTPRPSMSRNTA